VQPRRHRGVDEGHRHADGQALGAGERLDDDVEDLRLAAGQPALDVVGADDPALGLRLLDQGSELDRAVGDLEITQRAADVMHAEAELRPDLAVDQAEGAVDPDGQHRAG
jgi:hypothetical protein